MQRNSSAGQGLLTISDTLSSSGRTRCSTVLEALTSLQCSTSNSVDAKIPRPAGVPAADLTRLTVSDIENPRNLKPSVASAGRQTERQEPAADLSTPTREEAGLTARAALLWSLLQCICFSGGLRKSLNAWVPDKSSACESAVKYAPVP